MSFLHSPPHPSMVLQYLVTLIQAIRPGLGAKQARTVANKVTLGSLGPPAQSLSGLRSPETHVVISEFIILHKPVHHLHRNIERRRQRLQVPI